MNTSPQTLPKHILHTSIFLLTMLLPVGCSENPANTPDTSQETSELESDTSNTEDFIEDTEKPWTAPGTFCHEALCSAGPDHAPDPAQLGPFTVGVRTEVFSSVNQRGEERLLRTEIWYPGIPGTGIPEPFDYDLYEQAPDEVKAMMEGVEIPTITVEAYEGMEPAVDYGPYPLVIFSHGAYGIRFQSVFLTVFLASHGYVVVAPDHTGATLFELILDGYDMVNISESAFDRLIDGDFLIDHFIERTHISEDFFAGMIDPHNVGFTGHSFGGLLSLYEGGKNSHVRAVLPLAPASSMLGLVDVFPRTYPVPFMMQGGPMDDTLEYEKEMLKFYDDAVAPKYLVELARAGHYTYSDICMLDLVTLAEAINYEGNVDAMEDGCHVENIPFEEAHHIIRQFGIGFFNYYLRRSPDSKTYFSTEAAESFSDELRYAEETE